MTQKNTGGRRTVSRKRIRRQRRRKIILGCSILVAIVLLIVLIVVLTNRKGDHDTAQGSNVIQGTPAPEASLEPTSDPIDDLPSSDDVQDDTQLNLEDDLSTWGDIDAFNNLGMNLVSQPTTVAYPERAVYRPNADPGWLPVFKKANTNEKIIAITVDDCFQASNLRTIVQTAIDCGGKLTIFPIGLQALRDPQQEILRFAWENGMEIENHTFTHNGLYGCSNEDLAGEVYMQNLAITHILNADYTQHFLRPKGGDARDDQRIHAYAEQMGYYGIAHWSISGSGSSIAQLKATLGPGEIYLFHTTDLDLAKLAEFIPYAVSQGYQLVTLNDMFGYPENVAIPLSEPINLETVQIPQLQPYDMVPVSFREGRYAWGVKLIQDRLVELGYLSGGADGIYGTNTVNAVKAFQTQAGISATGEADINTQNLLFAATAPRKL